MSPSDLQQLGDALRARREASGLSLRQAAERASLVPSTLSRLETGQIEGPRLEHLQALARTYGADVEDFYALAGYLMPEGLPELRPYLRAKYGLPESAATRVDEYFKALREELQGRPNAEEDRHHDGGDTPN